MTPPTGRRALLRGLLASVLSAVAWVPASTHGQTPAVNLAPADRAATENTEAVSTPAVVVLGDSLSAGYGLDPGQGWVDLLRGRLRAAGHPAAVINASISGDTSRGGLARLEPLLARVADGVLVVELGGNDGLRGVALDETRSNLTQIVARALAHGLEVLLVGMQLPPNLGPVYTRAFAAIYPQVASAHDVALVPFLLDGVALEAGLMQADGIHPRAEAQGRLLDNVWPHLEPLLP